MIECSIGVMAYNEARNIGALLDCLLAQKTEKIRIREIIVVASGCTDDTIGITRAFVVRDSRVQLLIQEKRDGKMSAINLFLRTARSPVAAIVNADLLLRDDFAEKLISPFSDEAIGMTGGRVVPLDAAVDLMGFAANFLWEFHHQIALLAPKMGEAVAYRRPDGFQFPDDTVDDEGVAEAAVIGMGLALKYVPDAVCYNKNPRTIREFFRRRRNIFAGHLQLRSRSRYAVSTLCPARIVKNFPAVIRKTGFSLMVALWVSAIVVVEIWARIMGAYDFYVLKRDHSIWDTAVTSKRCLL